MQGKPIDYRADVDGLRAVAVLVVVLFHAGFEQLSGGYIGVDVFFVISGYVIMLSLLHMLDNGRFSITEFYYRRAKRIMPALFFTLLLTTVAAHALFLPELYQQYLQSLIAALTFLSNLFFWKTTNYFGSAAELKPLLHTWSLSLEEQYYIFAPLYVAAVYRWFNKNWYWALYPPLIASFLLSCFLMDKAASANYFMLPTRGWEILLGAVLAAAPPFKVRSVFVANLLSISGIALIVFAALYFDKSTAFPGYSALLPCLGAGAIILAGSSHLGRSNLVGKGLALRPIVYVGLLSYSLYLVHWPVTVFFKYYRLAPLTLWDSLTVIGLSFFVALISYYSVELPFRKRTWSRKAIFSASGVGIAGFVSFAVSMQVMQAPTSLERSQTVVNSKSDPCFLMNAQHYSNWSSEECTLVSSEQGPKVLMWGDSFLNHYTTGLKKLAENHPMTLFKYASAGCPPIMSFESFALPYCDEFNRNAIALIEELDIELVVLSAKWSDHQKSGLVQIKSTLERLDDIGVNYLVFGQSPQFITDVNIIDDQKGQGKSSNAWPTTINHAINSELESLVTNGGFINPMVSLCENQLCEYKLDGEMLFSDYGHLSRHGSLLVVKNLSQDIAVWLK